MKGSLSMFSKFKNKASKSAEYRIDTYTLIKGVQLIDENSVICSSGVLELEMPEYITWKYLRGSNTLEDAFANMNEEMNNMIPFEMFNYAVETLKNYNIVYSSSSESDITQYIETDCQTVINAELVSDIRSKVYLKHLRTEIILTPREYSLLKAIIKGEYDSIDLKDWSTFFALYKKEAISFI